MSNRLRMTDAEFEELRALANERCEEIVTSYLGQPLKRSRREARWGDKTGSFCLVISGHKRGLWFDHNGSDGGGMLGFLRQQNSGDKGRAIDEAIRFTSYAPPSWSDTGLSDETARALVESAKRRAEERAQERAKSEQAEQQDIQGSIRAAQRIAGYTREIDPGSPCDVYLTQTRGIPRPANGWPSSVRRLLPWNDLPEAVVFLATDATGQIVGVQRVEVTDDARKIQKRSRGAFAATGGVVRLPGPANGPLQIAEGPETALSCWAATGHETWIALGSLAKLALPAGRIVIACRDDDPQSSPSDKALRRATAKWQQSGHTVRIAAPWEIRRFDKSDFNDVLKTDSVEAVRTRINAALTAPEFRKRVPVKQARQQVHRVVSQFVDIVRKHKEGDPIAVLAAKIAVAVGKSSISREEVAKLLAELRAAADARSIVFLVPTHALGKEAADSFNLLDIAQSAGLKAAIWRGRSAEDPDAPGQAMCRDLERVDDAMKSYMDIEKSCCRKKTADGIFKCPFYSECGYQRQKTQTADVWFGAHELLFMEKPKPMGEVAAVIIDETFWQDGLEAAKTMSLSQLEDAPVPDGLDGQRLQFLRSVLDEALTPEDYGPVRRAAFNTMAMNTASAADAHPLEWRMKLDPGFHPRMTRKEYKEARERAANNRTVQRLASMWKAVEALLRDDGPEASGRLAIVKEEREEGFVRALEIKGRKEVRAGWNVPTLILDATLEIDLVRPYFPQVALVADVAAQAPHQRIIQTVGRSYSKSYFDEGKGETHLKKLATTISTIARRYVPERVLVVAQQDIEDWLQTSGNLPANVELAHHNAVAGLDQWGPQKASPGVAAMICVGRTIPSPVSVEVLAEALTGVAIERLGGWYQKHQAIREMADGSMAQAEADFHPHPIAEAIRRDICEGQIVQIVGRPRGVNRTAENPVDIFILTDVPLPLPVDLLLPADELDPTPADRMLEAEGVALDSPTDMSEVFPGLWKTPGAARKASQRAPRCGTESYMYSYRTLSRTSAGSETEGHFFSCCETGGGFGVVEYQRRGSGKGVAQALFDLRRVPDPESWLTAKFGELADFQMGEVTPSKPKRPPQPEPSQDVDEPDAPAEAVAPAKIAPGATRTAHEPIEEIAHRPAWTPPPPPPPTVLGRMPWAGQWAGGE